MNTMPRVGCDYIEMQSVTEYMLHGSLCGQKRTSMQSDVSTFGQLQNQTQVG